MKKHFRFAILVTLALMFTMGLVYAQPVPIGMTVQPEPFESNPQLTAQSGTSPVGATMMYDGDMYTSGNIVLGTGLGSTAYFELKTFLTPALQEWDPAWVEIKMKYEVPSAATDDKYRIEYTTDGVTWIVVEDYGGAKYGTFSLAIRPWSQVAEPNDGTWTWSDISGLRFRIYCTKAGLGWDAKKMYIYEVWATVYPVPLPPVSSTTVSMQPGAVTRLRPYDYMLGGVQGLFFVELYVNDVTDMFTYEMWLEFDTRVLTPYEAWTYYPWTRSLAADVFDDTNGWVRLAYGMAAGTPIGQGFTGNSPFARIYFIVDAYGGGGGGGATADIKFKKGFPDSFLGDTTGVVIPSAWYDGWFSGSRYMSGTYAGGDPVTTTWHELYPQYCNYYDITDWTDTDGSTGLSVSDQIEMYNQTDGTTKEYHVDSVTVTIYWTFKSPDTGEGAAEPYEPIDTPIISPYGYWHQIWPPDQYCRWFEITSWDEAGTPGTPGEFDASDQFDFYYLDEGVTKWAHLDEITVDILVSEKPGVPEVAEFPLGLGVIMILAPAIPIIYLWRTRKWVGTK